MTDDAPLVVRDGGSTVVATEALLARRDAVRAASTICADQAGRVRWVRQEARLSLGAELDQIERDAVRLADDLAALAHGVQSVAEAYGLAERAVGTWVERLASAYAAAAGWLALRLGVVALPGVLVAAGTVAAWWRLLPQEHRAALESTAAAALPDPTGALSEPVLVESTRWALTLVDDAAWGAMGAPPPLVALVGEPGLGVSGISGAATSVLGLAALAGLHGTASVRVDLIDLDLRRSGGRGGASNAIGAPRSIADRVDRIPEPTEPVRIERYEGPDGARFEVYIAGTDSTASLGGSQPWDMASNVALIAGHEASSLQAVREALRVAGASADSSVVFTGYSQGGAIATRLAESGEWSTAGLVTVGSPSGNLAVHGDYPAILVEHREDLVPGLSGIRRETEAVVVQAEAIDAQAASVTGALPAHDLDRYRATASRVDAATAREVRREVDALPGAGAGEAQGVVLRYTATRISPP